MKVLVGNLWLSERAQEGGPEERMARMGAPRALRMGEASDWVAVQ